MIGSLSFAAGETVKTIAVTVNGSAIPQADKTFFVNLSNAANAGVSKAKGTGTIHNQAAAPALSINDVSLFEGNTGTTNAVFNVVLSGPSGQTVTVDYATANGTALSGSDFISASGTLTFSAGVTTQTVTVFVKGDTQIEADETFFVILSNPTNATLLNATGQGTIRNDDT